MKILVRMPNWLGDNLLALPALRSIIDNYPQAEIWVAAPSRCVELFETEPRVIGVLEIPESLNLFNLWRLSRRWRSYRFDLTFLFPNSFASALLAFLAGIPERWGYKSDGRSWLLTKAISRQFKSFRMKGTQEEKDETDYFEENFYSGEKVEHQVMFYLRLLKELNLQVPVQPEITLQVNEKEKEAAYQRLLSLGLDPIKLRAQNRPIIVLNPGAAYGPAKRWPAKKFGSVAAELERETGAICLIIGLKEEKNLAEEVVATAKQQGIKYPPLIFSGMTTLRELMAILTWTNLMITNDSGPMHLANALRVPVVALFGPTDPRVTGPWHQPSLVLHRRVICWPCWYRVCPYDHLCLTSISEAEVLQAALSLLPLG